MPNFWNRETQKGQNLHFNDLSKQRPKLMFDFYEHIGSKLIKKSTQNGLAPDHTTPRQRQLKLFTM